MPGTDCCYAGLMAVCGETPKGIHLGVTLVNALTIILVFILGRRLLDVRGGLVAAASYGLLSTSPAFCGMAAHANHFVVFFFFMGLLVLLRTRERPGFGL